MISSGPVVPRSICIHRSCGIKYTRHVHESDNCHSSYADVSINRSSSFLALARLDQRAPPSPTAFFFSSFL